LHGLGYFYVISIAIITNDITITTNDTITKTTNVNIASTTITIPLIGIIYN